MSQFQLLWRLDVLYKKGTVSTDVLELANDIQLKQKYLRANRSKVEWKTIVVAQLKLPYILLCTTTKFDPLKLHVQRFEDSDILMIVIWIFKHEEYQAPKHYLTGKGQSSHKILRVPKTELFSWTPLLYYGFQ